MNCDSIQLYSVGKNIPLQQAVRELGTRVSLPSNAIRILFPKWKREICDPMTNLIACLERGRRELIINSQSAWSEMMRNMNIFMGSDPGTLSRTVAKFLCGVSRTRLAAAIDPWTFNRGCSKQFHYVVLPFCDVFNRPRSLLLFDRRGVSWDTVLPLYEITESLGRIQDTGLCFLDQLRHEEEVVFAVGDPRLALQLQVHHSFNSMESLPLVGYTATTGQSSWNQVRSREIVFWAPKLNADLFKQARYANNAFVATRPNYELYGDEKRLQALIGFQVDTWRQDVKASAKPWRKALVDWLLDLPEDEALEAVEYLDLTATEAEELLEGLEGHQEAKLIELFGVSKQSQAVTVDGRTIMQAEGKWVEMHRMGPKLVLDGTIYLDRVQHSMSGGDETVVGFITREGTVIPFHDKLSEVQENTTGWLTRILMAEGQPIPQIAPVWSRRLFQVAQAFHNPVTVQCVDRVGYIESIGTVFPNFVIKDGKFLQNEKEVGLLDSAVPGQDIEAPEFPVEIPQEAFEDNPVSVSAWTLISFILSNMEAQRFGAENKGILVYAPDTDDAPYVAAMQLAKNLSLPVYEYTADMDLLAVDKGHVLPIVVDARKLPVDRMTLSQYLFDPNPKSLMLIVSDLSPWKEVSLAGWLLAACQRSPLEKFPFDKASDILFSGLDWLYKTRSSKSSMLSLKLLQSGITNNIKCSRSVPADNLTSLVNRVKRSSMGDIKWDTLDSDRSLTPFFYMYGVKDLKVDDDATGVLTIPSGVLLPQFRHLTGCEIQSSHITYALRKAGMLRGMPGCHIAIDVSDWHSHLRQYKNLMPPEGLCL